MAAEWYVPVFAGPPLVISHVACIVLLTRRGSTQPARPLPGKPLQRMAAGDGMPVDGKVARAAAPCRPSVGRQEDR